MDKPRIAVIGAGQFGRNHLRVIHESPNAALAAVVDTDAARAAAAAAEFGCPAVSLSEVAAHADAAIVAVPTVLHSEIGCTLMEAGVDVLVEKPLASDLPAAQRLIDTARAHQRVLQAGHLERFNPAVSALQRIITLPLFFEVHRLSVFTPRSLDVDVVLDLMIHDLDIVLTLAGQAPEEIRAAGISILSRKVDIANVRLAFPNGCIANFTASRVSTERVRKLRVFQPRQYISIDYARQDGAIFEVSESRQIGFRGLEVTKAEPLKLELEEFFHCVRTRRRPLVAGEDGFRALETALAVTARIEEHARQVSQSLALYEKSRGVPRV